MASGMLRLSRMPSGQPEIFSTIQGEGPSIGLPSVFARLSSCNLRCAWCDTAYTWDWSRYDPKVESLTMETDAVAKDMIGTGLGAAVITGGEPLLQQREVDVLVRLLKAAGLRVEIETNGTLHPLPASSALRQAVNQWNVSPKLASSGNGPERTVTAALEWFANQPNSIFKFVIVSPEDLAEVQAFNARWTLPPERIILMPEGRDPEALQKRSAWLVDRCIAAGFRYSPRLHVLLWGDQRGR